MPFTLSHPAAVLPLRRYCRTRIHFVAVIVGSMTPDFGYYVGQFGAATFAHTIAGSFALCLPTGLLVMAVVAFMRRPLQLILPWPHRDALTCTPASSWRFSFGQIAMLCACLLIGA